MARFATCFYLLMCSLGVLNHRRGQRILLVLMLALNALAPASVRAATHTWTGAAYGDGALADGDTVVGVNVTNNCTLTNNNLRITGTWSNATWTGNVIAGTGLQGLVISNLILRATDNGLGLTYSNQFNAISLSGSDITIRDSTITNLYYRYESTECGAAPQGIVFAAANSTNVLIHNNRLDMLANAIVLTYGGWSSNVQAYSNTITRVSWGIFLNTTSAGDAYGWRLWANSIDQLDAWNPLGGPCAASYHNDCVIVNASTSGATNHSLKIDRNRMGPTIHIASSMLYVNPDETYKFPGLQVVNNLFLLDATGTNAPMCHVRSVDALVANNTLIGPNQATHGVIPGVSLFNNLCVGVSMAVNHSTDGYPTASDYNVWNGPVADSFDYSPFETWPDWQARGFDANSTTNAPNLDGNYVPTGSDTVARGAGTNLTALGITTDFNGRARPASAAWTIGAFEVYQPATILRNAVLSNARIP